MGNQARRRAFTMIELMAVCLIIGLLMTFVIIAAQGAARDSQREATRGLIAKLDNAMNQLVDAVQTSRVNPTFVHLHWAATWTKDRNGNLQADLQNKGTTQRAQVLANYDEIRANVPDCWFSQEPSGNSLTVPYPVNFAQQPFAGVGSLADYCLPIGVNYQAMLSNMTPTPGTGIFGASYGTRAGLVKNLGNVDLVYVQSGITPQQLLPQGADGVDNNGNGQIDEITEGVQGNNNVAGSVVASLQQHKHATARSEMLYALLVEGQSQFGAFLNRDDFTSKEVQDTDNDGLPEFVDAWGKPLQFYRWPIMYHSDVQKGIWANPAAQPCNSSDPPGPYAGVFETREQDTLDPNQRLMDPMWWANCTNLPSPPYATQIYPWQLLPVGSSGVVGANAMAFQKFFRFAVEPLDTGSPSSCMFWDRSNANAVPVLHPRRAFYARHLIISGGPDGIPGVPILDDQIIKGYVASNNPSSAAWAIQLESMAAQYDLSPMLTNLNPTFTTFFGGNTPSNADPANPGQNYFDEGLDDITNHNLNSTAQVAAQ